MIDCLSSGFAGLAKFALGTSVISGLIARKKYECGKKAESLF